MIEGRKSANGRGEYVIDYNHTESCPLPCLDYCYLTCANYCYLTTYADKYLRSLLQCRITGFLLCIQESLHALNLPGTAVQTMGRIPQAARCMVAHFQIIIVIFSLKLIPTGAYSGLSLSAVRICYTLCACVLVRVCPSVSCVSCMQLCNLSTCIRLVYAWVHLQVHQYPGWNFHARPTYTTACLVVHVVQEPLVLAPRHRAPVCVCACKTCHQLRMPQ